MEAGLPAAARALANRHHLLSERHVTYWGEDRAAEGRTRLCVIMGTDDYATHPALLSVQPEGFLDRMTARAAAEGLTDHDLPDSFTPAADPPGWSAPGDGPGELRIVVLPHDRPTPGRPLDIGIIIVAAGTDTLPGS